MNYKTLEIEEIEQKVDMWFSGVQELLKEKLSAKDKDEIDELVFESIPVVENYESSIFILLEEERGRKLPSMALLRVLYQLVSRVIWVLKGKDKSDNQKRLFVFEKNSLEDRKKLMEKIIRYFEEKLKSKKEERKGLSDTEINEGLNNCRSEKECLEKSLKELVDYNCTEMNDRLEMIKNAFGSKSISLSGWPRLHPAVHPDYLLLKITKTNEMYEGDLLSENTIWLGFECATCVRYFLKEIFDYYKCDGFQRIDADYKKMIDKINSL